MDKWFTEPYLRLLTQTLEAAYQEVREQLKDAPPSIAKSISKDQWDFETEVRDGWAEPRTNRY